jgi:hypothetical protein
MKRRTRFVLIYFLALPIIVWFAFYGVGIGYHWLTGRGGPYWAMLIAWAGVGAVVIALLTSWRSVLQRLGRDD